MIESGGPRRTARTLGTRVFAALFLFLGVPVLLAGLLGGRAAEAGTGIQNSYHNFATPGEPGDTGPGACAFCHQPHGYTEGYLLWPRSLAEERLYFDQTSGPDYLPPSTLPCYDCHDDNANAVADDSPSHLLWPSGEEPQNIAFGDPEDVNNPTLTGYYELAQGWVPNKGNAPSTPSPPLNPPVTEPIGGHYWKGIVGGSIQAPLRYGDKMACRICHDPHDRAAVTGTNDAMIRTDIIVGASPPINLGSNLAASSASRNQKPGGTGREMCAGCHTYSNQGSPGALFGVNIPKPPVITYTGHLSTDTLVECTSCHPHNAPDCGSCHGSPPPVAAVGYTRIDEVQGPHPRHARPASQGGYDFDCGYCHDTFPATHNNGNYSNVSFEAGKNPSGAYTAANFLCSSLYCHSRGTSIIDTQNAAGTSPQWTGGSGNDWRTQDLGCEACHGAFPARTPGAGVLNYGAPGYVNGAPKANSHNAHRSYGCYICHNAVIQDSAENDGWTIGDESLHVNNTAASFTYNVDSAQISLSPLVPMQDLDGNDLYFASYAYAPAGGTCSLVDCHGGNSPTWGDTLDCVDCHARTAAQGGDLDDFDDIVPTLVNNGVMSRINAGVITDEWSATGHGRPVVSGWFPWPDNYPPRDPPQFGCLTTDASGNTPVDGCHAAKVPHGLAANPFRLATPNNTTYAFEFPLSVIDFNSVNNFCFTCHDTLTIMTHSRATTGGNDWTSPIRYKCTDCHDPHGDSPDYMIHAKVFTNSSSNYGVASTGGFGIQPTGAAVIDFNVTTPTQQQSDYVDLTAGSTVKICQVCHVANQYFERYFTTTNHNPGAECLACHLHEEGFKPLCEVCHSITTSYPQAPNVMGNGTDSNGTVAPFDDGTWGFNVNGHGAEQIDPDGAGGPEPVRHIKCEDCHNISDPPGMHFNNILNTRYYPGKPSGHTENANTSHLISAFFPAGSTPEEIFQTTFDNHCYGSANCHTATAPPNRHRHDSKHGDPLNPPPVGDTIMRFGDVPSTVVNPKTSVGRGVPYWTPWTVRDLTTNAPTAQPAQPPPSGASYGICISCHDPHGINGTSHLLRYPYPSGLEYFCNSNCHRP